jgi:hypothetical protein
MKFLLFILFVVGLRLMGSYPDELFWLIIPLVIGMFIFGNARGGGDDDGGGGDGDGDGDGGGGGGNGD